VATYADLITEAHQRFVRAVDGLDREILETEPAVGTWSARDVTAHVNDWAKEMLAALDCGLGAPHPAHHPIQDGEQFNLEHAALHTSEPWDTALANLDATMQQAADLARRVTPEQAEQPVSPPWGGATTIGQLLGSFPNHHNEHAEQLEAWRQGRRV
jgi:hypothetical protein